MIALKWKRKKGRGLWIFLKRKWNQQRKIEYEACYCSLFSCPVVSDSLRPHGLQHARPPCPSPSPGVCPSSCSLHWWHLTCGKKKRGGGRKKEKDTEDLVIKMGRDLSSASRCQSSELQGCGFRNSGNSVGICWNWVGRNVGTNMIFLRKCFSQPEAMTTEEAAATDTRAQDKTFLLMKDCGDGWLY